MFSDIYLNLILKQLHGCGRIGGFTRPHLAQAVGPHLRLPRKLAGTQSQKNQVAKARTGCYSTIVDVVRGTDDNDQDP
jgi:hypothetical protein